MFNNTESDFKKLAEVYNKYSNHKPKNEIGKKRTEELNKIFGESFTFNQWRWRHDRAIFRMKSHGSYLPITKSKKQEVVNDTKDINSLKSKLMSFIFKPKTIEQIEKHLDVDNILALGLIQSLRLDNYIITHNEFEGTYVVDKKAAEEIKEYHHSIGDVKEFEFLVVSDNHWCTKHQQKSFVNYIYEEAVRRGIKTVYHVGDIVDGYYKNRPEHIFELFAIGGDEQKDYVVENWPKHEGIKTYLILGNHDETHIKNGGYNIGKAIARERDDFEYLGIGHAKIWLTPNCRLDLFHPLDGSSYAVSYSGQKYMDSLSGGDKPNILFVGHHHKALYFPYRNIHYFEVPSMTQQSSWMKRKRIANESGAWFVKVRVDEEGTITSIIPEHIKQYKYLENDI